MSNNFRDAFSPDYVSITMKYLLISQVDILKSEVYRVSIFVLYQGEERDPFGHMGKQKSKSLFAFFPSLL